MKMVNPIKYLKDEKILRAEKAKFLITGIIRIILIIALISAIVNFRWTIIFVTILVFVLTFLPSIFEKKYKIDIPAEFEIITILFIYASLFLGEVHSYYVRFWWWDIILHTGSAIAFGFIGFILMYILYKGKKVQGSPIMISIFAFSFAVAMGAVWEVFEFAMDGFFGLEMQKSGLVDTMWDLIVDIVGALIASLSGYLYLKKGESFFFDKMIKNFEKENPRFFK
jgi:hypothetical protein